MAKSSSRGGQDFQKPVPNIGKGGDKFLIESPKNKIVVNKSTKRK